MAEESSRRGIARGLTNYGDPAFAAYVRRYIDGEVARSIEITPDAYRAATGWWQRVKQFFAYLIVGVADPTLSRGLNFGIDD